VKAQTTVIDSGYCGASGNNLTWVLTSDSVLTISGSGAMPNYTSTTGSPWSIYRTSYITTAVIGDSVTSIGNYAFNASTKLTSITIGNSVTSIGDAVFRYCTVLTAITFPNSVISIGSSVFSDCSALTTVTIGNSVTSIGNNTFWLCTNLQTINYNAINCTSVGPSSSEYSGTFTTLNIGNRVKSIPNNAFFNGSQLISVTIPDSVTSIDAAVFGNCISLTSIYVDSNNAVYASENGVLFNKSKTLLIRCPIGKTDTNYIIPNSVITIENDAFFNCGSLVSITISDSVTSIGIYAFRDCRGLISVTIGNSVTSIGNLAFYNCTSLQTVNFNAINCTSMPVQNYYPVFSGCSAFTTLNIGNAVITIPNNAFINTSITSVTIPNNVTSIGASAFAGCIGLTSITIPDSIVSIGANAFQYCSNLQTVNFNAVSCTTMGNSNSFVFPSVITTLNIGNNVRNIPSNAFYGTGITSVIIPDSVTNIGEDAFRNCTNLQTLNYNAINCIVPPHVGLGTSRVFAGCNITTLNIGNNVETIPALAFPSFHLTSVTIPNSVTSIGDWAFYACRNLTSVTIGNSVASIGFRSFAGCDSLKTITISNSVKTISNNAF
jgi:hypothetical protein